MNEKGSDKIGIMFNGDEIAEINASNSFSYWVIVNNGQELKASMQFSIDDKDVESVLFKTMNDPKTNDKFWYQWIDPRYAGSEEIKGMRKLDIE